MEKVSTRTVVFRAVFVVFALSVFWLTGPKVLQEYKTGQLVEKFKQVTPQIKESLTIAYVVERNGKWRLHSREVSLYHLPDGRLRWMDYAVIFHRYDQCETAQAAIVQDNGEVVLIKIKEIPQACSKGNPFFPEDRTRYANEVLDSAALAIKSKNSP